MGKSRYKIWKASRKKNQTQMKKKMVVMMAPGKDASVIVTEIAIKENYSA